MHVTPHAPRRLSHTSRRTRWALGVGLAVLIVVLASLHGLATIYTDYLWFVEVHFASVWGKTIAIQVALAAVFTAIFLALLLGNLVLADRLAPFAVLSPPDDELVSRWKEMSLGRMHLIRLAAALVLALFGGISAHSEWNNWLLYSNRVPFSTAPDPLNHLNDGFYVFQLPFLHWLVGWVFSALVVTILLVLVAHYLNGGIHPGAAGQRGTGAVKVHLSVLLAALALVKGVDYYLQRLSLVLSGAHVVDGATYTDVHANRPALVLLMAIAVIAAVLFMVNVRQRGWLLPGIAVALWVLVWVLVGNLYPALVQSLSVNPAENVKEAPYITRNIQATREAYGLTRVITSTYQGTADIQASQVSGSSPEAVANENSIANARLLDAQYVGSTFNKFQDLRGYYQLSQPATDRYQLAMGSGPPTETQALVSVRELNESPGAVPSSNWVNQHLQYTHGYGAVVAPANQSGVDISSGYPNFSLQNIPPTGTPPLSTQPRVYYGVGSSASGYVIADSNQPELDYQNPTNNAEISNRYSGNGGVPAGGLLRRSAFALAFGDRNVLISGQVTSKSRIMYYRSVTERLQKAAPFLQYDADPYAVVVDGSIYWVEDAYTTTANYPYSQHADTSRLPAGDQLGSIRFNYVRNSVKAVVDAYTGKMTFFVQDPSDPIIRTYEKAFPHLFTSMSEADTLIPGITAHWRYPEDIFTVQTNMYGQYHQTNPLTFFTKAQSWDIAQDAGSGPVGTSTTTAAALNPSVTQPPAEVASGDVSAMAPEYQLVHLPGQTQQSFVLVEAFVNHSQQNQQQNLSAFMTASADPSDYGTLRVFATSPGQQVDGPYLVSTAIQENQTISSEITLLNQQNSSVVFGNVVLLPLDESLLYVQPLYVEQQQNGVPKLNDVIVVYQGTAFHSGNASLDGALCAVTNPDGTHPFQSYCSTQAATTPTQSPKGTSTGGGKGSGSSTTSTTALPPVPTGSTVASLLRQAQADFSAAQAALQEGNLGLYQQQTAAGETLVAQASALAGKSSPSTTKPGTSSTTRNPRSSSTTLKPGATGAAPPSSG